jgi:sulfhydrogenase subunit alpha
MNQPKSKTLKIKALTRVEGEGGLHVRLAGDQVVDVQLNIFEPPRLFEALLVGRMLEDVPDITARICGICPVAYQMTAVHALEQALGVTITPELRQLRRLLYCGEWIESHGVHVHLLHLPDFFGCPNSFELAKRYPEEINRGLRLRKIGNRLLEILGGRAVHPVSVAVGGFYRVPDRAELQSLLPDLEWGLEAAVNAARWFATLEFPDFTQPYEMVALQHPFEYPLNEGRVVSTRGLNIETDAYEQHFEEVQVAYSTALHSVHLPERKPYFVGPLARLNLNRRQLAPIARDLSEEVVVAWPCLNPYCSIIARALEIVHAFEVALEIVRDYSPPYPARVPYEYREGTGRSATEAPRGLLYHRYELDADGRVVAAKIVPPTSQNQRQIESDLRAYLPQVLGADDQATALSCEKLIRSYDPCISCSTHFLNITVERQ